MGIKIKKEERETSQALVRRFTKNLKRSGVLLRAKAVRYKTKPKSRQMKKRAALRREKIKQEYAKLKKLGKIKK